VHWELGENQIDSLPLLSLQFANESSDSTVTVNLTNCSDY
jgi:hypothetical protein